MARRRAMASARREATQHPDAASLVCQRSGLLVIDAVRDPTGVLFDAKEAKLAQIDATPDEASTVAARRLLDAHMPIVSVPSGLTKWRKRFPQPTDSLLFFS